MIDISASNNDADLSDLLKELQTLKESETKTESSYYSRQIIQCHELIVDLLRGLPDSLKAKYLPPFCLRSGDKKCMMTDNGFIMLVKSEDIKIQLQTTQGKRLNISKSIADNVYTQIPLEELKDISSDLSRISTLFQKKLKREIIKEQELLIEKIRSF